MEAKVLGPAGKVTASLWFIGGWLLGPRGKVTHWEVAKETQADANGVQNMRLYIFIVLEFCIQKWKWELLINAFLGPII